MSVEFWLGVVAGVSATCCVYTLHWLAAMPTPPRVTSRPPKPPPPPPPPKR